MEVEEKLTVSRCCPTVDTKYSGVPAGALCSRAGTRPKLGAGRLNPELASAPTPVNGWT